MATLSIRNLDEDLKRRLRERAARQGISMEKHVRTALTDAASIKRGKAGGWRLAASLDEILALGSKPRKVYDLKQLRNKIWDEGAV